MCWEGQELSQSGHEPFPFSLRTGTLLPFPLFGIEPGWSRYILVPRICCESLRPPPHTHTHTVWPVTEEHRERWGKKRPSFHLTLQLLFADLAELEWPPLHVAHRFFYPVPCCEAISGLKKSELRGDWFESGNHQPLLVLLLCSVPRW